MEPIARAWVGKHVLNGFCEEGGFKVDLRPGDLGAREIRKDMVVLEFRCRDVTTRYWNALPDLSGH